MIFANCYITTTGKTLLTRATTGNTIVWGSCGLYSQNINNSSQSEINELTTLTGPVALGSTSAVFEQSSGTSGIARLTCSVDNSQTGASAGYANTFGLWAKIEGDASEVLVLVARVGSNAATYFPAYTDATTRLQGIINLSVTVDGGAASTISVTQAGVALASNLQAEIDAREALESRVVTTHSSSSTTTGEDQDIYGVKKFHNDVTIYNSILPYNALSSVGDDIHAFGGSYSHLAYVGAVYKVDSTADAVYLNTSVRPFENQTYNLGNDNYKFLNVYSVNFNGTNIGSTTDRFTTAYVNTIYGTNIGSTTDRFTTAYVNTIYGTNIGGSTNYFTNVNSSNVTTDNLYSLSSRSISLHGSILPSGLGYMLGSNDNRFSAVYANHVECGGITGVIPVPEYDDSTTPVRVSVPIGAIVMINVNSLYHPGLPIVVGANTYTFASPDGTQSSIYVPAGTYKTLSMSSNTGGPCLVIRIS